MELKIFERTLKNNNALRFDDNYILFNDLELYNFETEQSITFKDYKELYDYKFNNKTIKDFILNLKEFKVEIDGGRGSTSSNQQMGGGFNHADRRRGKGENYGAMEYPSKLNVAGQRYKSYDKTLSQFEKMYKNADIEYGATVDEQGFTHRLIKGGSTSVPISGAKGEMIIHNHPSGGNFSDSDLITVASGSEKGIVATGSNVKKGRTRYTFTKTNKFKSKEFIKAVKKAQWPTHLGYDKGADWWLRKNAKTYGYKYTARKIK